MKLEECLHWLGRMTEHYVQNTKQRTFINLFKIIWVPKYDITIFWNQMSYFKMKFSSAIWFF